MGKGEPRSGKPFIVLIVKLRDKLKKVKDYKDVISGQHFFRILTRTSEQVKNHSRGVVTCYSLRVPPDMKTY